MSRFVLMLLILITPLAAFVACEGCRAPGTQAGGAHSAQNGANAAEATARLYLISDLAGALEPCGCVKDQLGGMDHFGALVSSEKTKAKASAVLTAGPLFFMDMELSADKRAQESAKAETIAGALKAMNLAGFAPGRNDWAGGDAQLAMLRDTSGAPMLGANLKSTPAPARWTVKDVGGLKLGILGLSAPDTAKLPLPSVESTGAVDAARAGVEALKKEGVQAIVALAAVGRGEAKRIADACPELLAIVVGSPGTGGEANTQAPPAERIGDVLIVETANHLQTVAMLDLFPRGSTTGLVKFADATGVERVRRREELTARIDELRAKIAIWENDGKIDKRDIDARRADVARLETERDALDKTEAPATGSFYRYATREIRDQLGVNPDIKSKIASYYRTVNEHNKVEFKDRKPAPPPKGQPRYVGIEACTTCHEEPRAVWNQTRHARAYETLTSEFKEFNLDCVSCHVTGYDRPGGSTVTHVDELKDVQCEVCHGPGELHAKNPKVAVPTPSPPATLCESCHHPPHVHAFDAMAKMPKILGPGHGLPKAH